MRPIPKDSFHHTLLGCGFVARQSVVLFHLVPKMWCHFTLFIKSGVVSICSQTGVSLRPFPKMSCRRTPSPRRGVVPLGYTCRDSIALLGLRPQYSPCFSQERVGGQD